MRNILFLLITIILLSCNQSKGRGDEENKLSCYFVPKCITSHESFHLKSYYLSNSYQDSLDTCIVAYNDRLHALDVVDCKNDTIYEILLDRDGNNAVQGRLSGIFVHNMDSIWAYSEAMLVYLLDNMGNIRGKWNLHAWLKQGEEVMIETNHAVCTASLFYDSKRKTLLYGIIDGNSKPVSFKVREVDIVSQRVIKDYTLFPSEITDDTTYGYANMNRVNLAFHDSLIIYNYPIESNIYVLNRKNNITKTVAGDSYYTENQAKKCFSKSDYSQWEKHQVENIHFYDVMYLPKMDIYVRLHLSGVEYDKKRTLGELLSSRRLYASFFDRDFYKIGECQLQNFRYSYYTGWCAMHNGVILFVDNELRKEDFTDNLLFDWMIPIVEQTVDKKTI